MNRQTGDTTLSEDGLPIHFLRRGHGEIDLVFVHGWLGNAHWWDAQAEAFSDRFRILQMDLGGHGHSGKDRKKWTVEAYAQDVVAVLKAADSRKAVLIGHSMSGVHVVEAAVRAADRVCALVVIDALNSLDYVMEGAAIDRYMGAMQRDYRGMVLGELAADLFCATSPKSVVARIQTEFLEFAPDRAAALLEGALSTDIRERASQLRVPVRGIFPESQPCHDTVNRKYLRDFDLRKMAGVGHYPMLEQPTEFNRVLSELLEDLGY